MNPRSLGKLARGLFRLAGSVAALAAAAAADLSPAQPEAEGLPLERLTVTGSRIRRADIETISPVIRITAEDLEVSGFLTLAEAVRALPLNGAQAMTPVDSGLSLTPGINSFNFRALGSNNTLVLINGRRAAPYAVPGYDGFQTMFDLNSIPAGAIESLEILKDGGSALYGSDAVAGVLNLKLRRDYVGTWVALEVGNYFNTDALRRRLTVMSGAARGRTRLMVTASYEDQNAVFARDWRRSREADKIEFAAETKPRYIVENYQAAGFGSQEEYLQFWGLTDPVTDAGRGLGFFNNRSASAFPGAILDASFRRLTFPAPTDRPEVSQAISTPHLYNFQDDAGLLPSHRRCSLWSTLSHQLSPRTEAFAEFAFTRVRTRSEAAPTPVDLATEQGLTPGTRLTIPAYNPYNPWNTDFTGGFRRLVETGNRINDVTADTPRVLVGLRGELESGVSFHDWAWEATGLYTENDVRNRNGNSVPDYKLQQALNGLTPAANGTLRWDPATPLAERVYFNWFGDNPPAIKRFLPIDNPTRATLQYWSGDASLTGFGGHLPGGRVGLATGVEWRREKLAHARTELSATGMILSGAEGKSAFGARHIASLYAEASLPVFRWLEIQVAGRFERYSDDGFAERVRPKVAVKLQPRPWLALRASFSEAFKAPDLAYLYTELQTLFASTSATDPVTGQTNLQVQTRLAGNPHLRPETTRTSYVGLSLLPAGWLQGLTISVDYFRFQQRDLLARLSHHYSPNTILSRAHEGDPLFADRVVRDPVSRQLLYIEDSYANFSQAQYRGFDSGLHYDWSTARWGRFGLGAAATYIEHHDINGHNVLAIRTVARRNAQAMATWRWRDWGANLFGIYRGPRRSDYFAFTVLGSESVYVSYRIQPQYTLNASVSCRALRGAKLTAGVNNVLNTDAPMDVLEAIGTTAGVNDPSPAFWYLRMERGF